MNNSLKSSIYQLIDKHGLLNRDDINIAPTGALYIGANNFEGNELKSTGVFLSGDTFQGPSIFKKTVPAKFESNISQQTFTHIISTETEKNSLISDLAELSGHYASVSGSATLNFANEMHITQTSLSVFKYAYVSIGTQVFDFDNQELSDAVSLLLDPTTELNKDPKKYLENIKNFISTYGFYYISAYELYAELLASWQIDTASKSNKQEIESKLSGEISSGSADFSAVNNFVSKVSSSFSQTSSTYRSMGIGVNKNIQTIDQLNEVFNNLTGSVSEKTASISKIFLKPWSSLNQVVEYLSKISDSGLRNQVNELLNGPKLTQDIWDRMLFLKSSMLNLRTRIQLSIEDPYNNDFWGFLAPYEGLSIDKLEAMVKDINTLLDNLSSIDQTNFSVSFAAYQKKYESKWKQIQSDYMALTKTPTYSFDVRTGYFYGNVSPDYLNYTIIQGTESRGNFDPSFVPINSAFYIGPVFQRPYFFSTAWQQGVLSFIKLNQTDKHQNPFVIQFDCRLAWTGHLDWSHMLANMPVKPNQKKVAFASIYDTTLVSAPLRGIIGAIFTLNT